MIRIKDFAWQKKSIALVRPSRQMTYREEPIMPEKGPQLINLLSYTYAYAHEIAFMCVTQRYSRNNTSERVQYGCPHMYNGNMVVEGTGGRS
jgi:hypothetical protein